MASWSTKNFKKNKKAAALIPLLVIFHVTFFGAYISDAGSYASYPAHVAFVLLLMCLVFIAGLPRKTNS